MTGVRAALGVDLGTGSVKVAVVDEAGETLRSASRAYDLSSPHPGWAEADPMEWLHATTAAAGQVLDNGEGAAVVRVGFSGQMHGVVLCDESLDPVRPAITWADSRAGDEAADMQTVLGPEVLARLGSPAVSGFAATSLRWIRVHEPEALVRARYALQPKDWLRARLGGMVATEPSDASGTLLANVDEGSWNDDAITWSGVDRDVLPPIIGSSDPAGEIHLAGKTFECVTGASDTAAAITGLGLSIGDGFTAVGSGSQTVALVAQPTGGITHGTHLFATAGAPGSGWYRIGAVQNAGIALRQALTWLDATAEQANAALDQGVQASDPLFVPYVAGERTPFVDPGLRGAWLGLGLDTSREAMLRSVVEGVAHAVALGINAVLGAGAPLPDPLPLIGGGSVDARFRQLLADASGRRLAPRDQPDAAVVGAALLALGVSALPASGADDVIEPLSSVHELLAARQQRLVEYVQQGYEQ